MENKKLAANSQTRKRKDMNIYRKDTKNAKRLSLKFIICNYFS